MANTLYLKKRGCDFPPNYPGNELPENREIGNFRVFTRFTTKDGEVFGDFQLGRIWSRPLKAPVIFYLMYDLQLGTCRYQFPFITQDLPYTFAGILKAVNRVSLVKYDRCEFAEEV